MLNIDGNVGDIRMLRLVDLLDVLAVHKDFFLFLVKVVLKYLQLGRQFYENHIGEIGV